MWYAVNVAESLEENCHFTASGIACKEHPERVKRLSGFALGWFSRPNDEGRYLKFGLSERSSSWRDVRHEMRSETKRRLFSDKSNEIR